jgi:DNA repair exonuclease SbcCD ATPase subunit
MSTVTQTMELAEISQRVSFLDVERRKDKELIATLLERVEAQTNKLEAQSRQIQELEGVMASARAELARFTQVERAMEQLRQEVALLIEADGEKRDETYRELSRLRQVEQDATTRQITEMRKELDLALRHDEEIKGLRAEAGRINGVVQKMQHQFTELDRRSDDRVQSVIYLEEQRRQDNRRIAQLEGEAAALHKKADDLTGKSSVLEQAIQAKNKKIDEAAELMEQQAQIIEDQRVAEFRWGRQAAEWAKLVEELKEEVANMTSQAMRMREQSDMVRRTLADLESFRERIERRQNEMNEMQRLAQDRQKRKMEEWQAEREKERKLFQLSNEERWRDNGRHNERRDAQIETSEKNVQTLSRHVKALWDMQETWAQSVMISSGEWMATREEYVKGCPPLPEPLKPVPSAPSQAPEIRPLPSVQAAKEEEKGE